MARARLANLALGGTQWATIYMRMLLGRMLIFHHILCVVRTASAIAAALTVGLALLIALFATSVDRGQAPPVSAASQVQVPAVQPATPPPIVQPSATARNVTFVVAQGAATIDLEIAFAWMINCVGIPAVVLLLSSAGIAWLTSHQGD